MQAGRGGRASAAIESVVQNLLESNLMAFALTYTEHRPPSDLTPWIACFWQIVGGIGDGPPVLHRVLPDGCADLLFDLEGTRRIGGTPADLVGPMSGAQKFELHGAIDLLGVRLRPGAIGTFGGIPADRLLDTTAPISDLPPSLRVNVAELADPANLPARVQLLADSCRARLATLGQPDSVVRQALAAWASAERSEFPTVSVLTRDIGLSERAFERRFVAQVGLTPVRYRRLARFRSVLRLHGGGRRDWAALAACTGFSDQSHLVRDFRAFAGLTPTEWAASQAGPAGFLQDADVTTL
jgi:AraC-like DNA-binding protein